MSPHVVNIKRRRHEIPWTCRCGLLDQTDIAGWRQIYREAFGVKPSQFRSSVEALVRRVLKGKGVWQVSSIVDLYNCSSVRHLLPMGAYDVTKIEGDVALRYGQAGEVFLPLGSNEEVAVEQRHVVYADDEKVLCWLWNYRDSRLSALDLESREALFFIDAAFVPRHSSVEQALADLATSLEALDGQVRARGVLDAGCPRADL